ncbi:MAG: alpha/beta hydrolase [Pseudomonadota bacterium]
MNVTLQPIEPQEITVPLEDGDMAGLHWRAGGKQPLLFLHATGFCASVYKQMLTHLSGAYDIYALDLRGHGRSALPADPARLKSWHVYAADVCAFLDQQGREGWVLAGHSMGAATAVMAARGRADVAALQLIEPVAMPALFSLAARTPFWRFLAARIPMVSQAARRRNGWPNREAVKASYARKPIFKSWRPGVLEDYLEGGLREDGEGVALACDPKWEAATFAAHANDFWAAARVAPAPISVYAANHPSSTVPAMARRGFRRLGACVTEKSGPTHLAPMEEPAELANFLAGRGEFLSP